MSTPTKVKVYGAGSIGNHLTNACRSLGWSVTMVDTDSKALERTKNDIYPTRYGKWDEGIELKSPSEAVGSFDVVIAGTPPDSHMKIAFAELNSKTPPKVLLLEKPLCGPSLEGCDELWKLSQGKTFVGVGYNHALTRNTRMAEEWLGAQKLGKVLTLRSMTREYWGGIFKAHPWLKGPHETYLGFSARGGGALGEHSHAINIWQHFAHRLGLGRISEVSAMLDWVEEGGCKYDRIAQLSVRTEKGLMGTIVQDVVTEPAKKWLRVQWEKGFLEWEVNADSAHDAVRSWEGSGDIREVKIGKKRPDDFKPEIEHVGEILAGKVKASSSAISLERGLETMMVVAAAMKSSAEGRTVRIDYSKGWNPGALKA